MSGFEKSTPVSTIAMTISVPVELYFCFAIVEPVISPILETSGIIWSELWKSNLESSITLYPCAIRFDAVCSGSIDT